MREIVTQRRQIQQRQRVAVNLEAAVNCAWRKDPKAQFNVNVETDITNQVP